MRKAEKFKPKPGQIDFTKARWAPVMNSVLRYKGKILVVRRSPQMRLYPEYWNGIAGFLDDKRSLEEKVQQELKEEAGITKSQIISMKRGTIFDREEPKYKKTFVVHPVLVEVTTDKVELDWEATSYRWITPVAAKKLKLVPGFDQVLRSLSLIK